VIYVNITVRYVIISVLYNPIFVNDFKQLFKSDHENHTGIADRKYWFPLDIHPLQCEKAGQVCNAANIKLYPENIACIPVRFLYRFNKISGILQI
jgi:hypothetical protein